MKLRMLALPALLLPALAAQGPRDYLPSETGAGAGPRITKIRYILKDNGGRIDVLPGRNLISFDSPNRGGFTDVNVMNLDGTNRRCVTCGISALTEYKGNPAWSPDGKYILFQATDPSLPKVARSRAQYMQVTSPGSGWHNNLWVVTADGGQAWQLTHSTQHQGVIHAHFDETGNRLTWAQLDREGGQPHWSIKIANFRADGGPPQLSNVRSYTPGNLSFYETHGFSADGSKVIFTGKSQGFSESHFNWGIYTMDIARGTLTTLVDAADGNWNEHAHYTPDGTHIIWMSSMGTSQSTSYEGESYTSGFATLKTDYWIMNADGSNKHRLTYFNDPKSPMYIAGHVIASDLSFVSNTQMATYVGDNPGGAARHPGEIAVIDFAY